MPASRREVKNLRALPGIVHRCCGRRGEYLFRDRREISPEKTFFRPLLHRMLDKRTKGITAEGRPQDLRDHSDDPYVRRFFRREAE